MKNIQETVAVLGSILALVSTLIAIVKGYRELKKPNDSSEQSTNGKNIEFRKRSTAGLDDLGIFLLAGTTLSVIAIDALIVPYFSGSVGWVSGIAAIACSAVIIGLTIISWKVGTQYIMISIISGFLLIVLTVSAGGMFYEVAVLSENSIPSATLMEVCALLFLCVLSCRHLFEKKNNNNQSNSALLLTTAIAIPTLLTTIAIAIQLTISATQDPRAPQSLELNTKEIIDDLSTAGKRQTLIDIYRDASEISLNNKYRMAATKTARLLQPPKSNEDVSETKQDKLSKETSEILRTLRDKTPKAPPIISTIPLVFDLQSLDEQTNYLLTRLQWIYPTSKPKMPSSPFSLPGIDTDTRLENLSDTRIHVALTSQRQIQEEFTGGAIRYSQFIMAAFGKSNMEDPISAVKQVMGNMFGANASSRLDQDVLDAFPYRDLGSQSAQFGAQIALPTNDEIVIAHHEYRTYAKANLRATEPTTSVFLDHIEQLDEKTQLRIENLLSSTEKPALLMSAIGALSDIELTSGLEVRGATHLLRLADAIRLNKQPEEPTTASSEMNKVSTFEQLQKLVILRLAKLPDERTALINMLQKEARQDVSVSDIFSGAIPKVAHEFNNSFEEKIRTKLIDCLANPVQTSILRISEIRGNYSAKVLKKITEMSKTEREILLHHFAIKIYRNDGEHALTPVKQIILQAFTVSYLFGYGIALLASLPLAIFIAGIALIAERSLTARSVIARGADADDARQLDRLLPREPTQLLGRADFLSRIERLINKASSTIAFTGRRGSGKSRLLREVYRAASENGKVAVWLDCPSRYAEDELLKAMVEKLSSSTESTSAKLIGIPNYSERSMERVRAAQTWNIAMFLSLLVALIAATTFAQSSRSETFALWLPLVPVYIIAIILVIFGGRSTSESPKFAEVFAKSRNYELSMLFIRASTLLRELTHEGFRKEGLYAALMALRAVSLGILGLFVLQQLVSIFFYKSPGFLGAFLPLPSMGEQITGTLVLCLLWFFIYLLHPESPLIRKWNNLAMVELYRNLSTEIVVRSRRGSLVTTGPSIVVCVDELDKVADQNELISLVKIIKPLLDIDGVVFYFSISEDALSMLRLGIIAGKDIFDSTFDHIERVPPVSLETATSIAEQYFTSITGKNPSTEIIRALALLSFGIPRDIVRLSDEIKANFFNNKINGPDIIRSFRVEKTSAARASGIITQIEQQQLEGISTDVWHFSTTAFLKELDTSRVKFFSFSLLLSWLERTIENSSNETLKQSLAIYELGYEIPLLSKEEIIKWIELKANFLFFTNLNPVKITHEEETD